MGSGERPWRVLLGACQTARSLAQTHARLVAAGLGWDLSCQTKLASSYSDLGDVDGAVKVFDRIQNPDLYSWKVMLRWLLQREKYGLALQLYQRMKLEKLRLDNVVYAGLLKAAAEARSLCHGRRLHCDIIKAASPDSFVLNTLLDVYCKCGVVDCARRLFDEMPDRDVVSWSCMIAGCVQNDRAVEGVQLFNCMRRETETMPNGFTVGGLIAAGTTLDDPGFGRCIHGHVIKMFMTGNCFVAARLLGMYSNWRMLDDARLVFDELPSADVVSWTVIIAGYAQAGKPQCAVEVFCKLREWLAPNAFTLASLLSAASQLEGVTLGETLHGLATKFGLEEEYEVTNAAITMYARHGRFRDARRMFERNCNIPHGDVVSWNAMIAGHAQWGLAEEALWLFLRMKSAGQAPDAVTLVATLSACAFTGDLCVGQQCHAEATKRGVLGNVFAATALLDVYAKSGDEGAARAVFDGMRHRSQATWGAMICGHGTHGDPTRSLSLLREMTTTATGGKDPLAPNDSVYNAALAACRHTGMLTEGHELFGRLCEVTEMVPRMAHYSSMVDLLARAGHLDEAMDFIHRMPMEPSAAIWGAFLHGCRVHSRTDLGESAVCRILDLHPTDASYYLLTSAHYASLGRWAEAAQIRQDVKSRGLSKSPGYSISNIS